MTNTGRRSGHEAALWFLTDEVGRITRPVRLLKHFEKQAYAPGESREMVFAMKPRPHLSYPGPDGQQRAVSPCTSATRPSGSGMWMVGRARRRLRHAPARSRK